MKAQKGINTKDKIIFDTVCNFVDSIFIECFVRKNQCHKKKYKTPLQQQVKSKKKHIKHRSIEYKTDLTLGNNLLNGHNKPKTEKKAKKSINLNKSIDSTGIAEHDYTLSLNQVSMINKEIKEYIKKVNIISNRITALTMHENELSMKVTLKENKEKTIENVLKEKKLLKETLIQTKIKKKNEKELLKEKAIKAKKIYEEKVGQRKKEQEEKLKKISEILKTEQGVVKELGNKPILVVDKDKQIKKSEYKEYLEQTKVNELIDIKKQEQAKRLAILVKLKEDKEKLTELKDKCLELEKRESECIDKFRTTKQKSISLSSAVKTLATRNHKEKNNNEDRHSHYYNKTTIIKTTPNENEKGSEKTIKEHNTLNYKDYDKDTINNIIKKRLAKHDYPYNDIKKQKRNNSRTNNHNINLKKNNDINQRHNSANQTQAVILNDNI